MKNVISGALIVFVCISIGYLVYSEMMNNRVVVSSIKQEASNQEMAKIEPSSSTDTKSKESKSGIPEKIIVYYFHGTARCPTCRAIERYAKEAVEQSFQNEIDKGVVEFRSVNVEEPQNEHYIDDFQLRTRCVVVEWNIDGKTQDFKRLEEVWSLVHGDKKRYYDYIEENVRQYLKG